MTCFVSLVDVLHCLASVVWLEKSQLCARSASGRVFSETSFLMSSLGDGVSFPQRNMSEDEDSLLSSRQNWMEEGGAPDAAVRNDGASSPSYRKFSDFTKPQSLTSLESSSGPLKLSVPYVDSVFSNPVFVDWPHFSCIPNRIVAVVLNHIQKRMQHHQLV